MFYETPELRRMLREFIDQYLNFRKRFQRNVILDVSLVAKKQSMSKVPGLEDVAQQNSNPNKRQQIQELMPETLDGGNVADVNSLENPNVCENSVQGLAKLDSKEDVVELNDGKRTINEMTITKF
jgi:hypothetical protein